MKTLTNLVNQLKKVFTRKARPSEEQTIRKTGLFSSLDEEDFQKLMKSIKVIKYEKGDIIIEEGKIGDTLYVIFEGSVKVFTYDLDGNKTPLAILHDGDYFGEQALLGAVHKVRNANVEALTDTTVMEIKEEYLASVLKKDFALWRRLRKDGYSQAWEILQTTTGFYKNLDSLINQIDEPNIVEFNEDDIIFHAGDTPDFAYVILEGEVEIQLPTEGPIKKYTSLKLHRGHIFGELGIIEKKARAGTAIAREWVKLIAINKEDFNLYFQDHPEVKEIISSLKKVYDIPNRGSVEQFFGSTPEMGPIITTLYYLEDGREIVAAKSLQENMFTMTTLHTEKEKHFRYTEGYNSLEINTIGQHITGIKAVGTWEHVPILCGLVLENELIPKGVLANFEFTGQLDLVNKKQDRDIVCNCLSIKKEVIQEYISHGIDEIGEISELTGACIPCGGCEFRIMEMLEKSPWISATIKKVISHTPSICTYEVIPKLASFKSFTPGQHVFIQTFYNGAWIERGYFINDFQPNGGSLQFTLDIESEKLISNWLNDVEDKETDIKVTQPQGSRKINMDEKTSVVYFAEEIGIVPFISFAKELAKSNSSKNVEIVYAVLKEKNFIFKKELEEISQKLPNFTVIFKASDKGDKLNREEVLKAVKFFKDPTIYYCGSTQFLEFIKNNLHSIDYNVSKMHEQYYYPGVSRVAEE